MCTGRSGTVLYKLRISGGIYGTSGTRLTCRLFRKINFLYPFHLNSTLSAEDYRERVTIASQNAIVSGLIYGGQLRWL